MATEIKYFESEHLAGHGRAFVIAVLNREATKVRGEYHVTLPDAPQPRIVEAKRIVHQPGTNAEINPELEKYYTDAVFFEILKGEATIAVQRLADTLQGHSHKGVALREVDATVLTRLLMLSRYEPLLRALHASSPTLRHAGIPKSLETARILALRTE